MGFDILAQLRCELPLLLQPIALPPDRTVGLVIVDEEKGFCSVGCGHLAPTRFDTQIHQMVQETNKLAKDFSFRGWPMLVLMDTHDRNKPEPPYPPHCIKGSGEDELVPELQWLEQDEHALIVRKDCINGFIGAMQKDGSNSVVEWVKRNQIQLIIVVGICTDVCVLDFVVTVLSARNHGMLAPLEEVLVYSEACATFDLPREVAQSIEGGVPAHPQGVAHHMGLYLAQARGARIVDKVSFPHVCPC